MDRRSTYEFESLLEDYNRSHVIDATNPYRMMRNMAEAHQAIVGNRTTSEFKEITTRKDIDLLQSLDRRYEPEPMAFGSGFDALPTLKVCDLEKKLKNQGYSKVVAAEEVKEPEETNQHLKKAAKRHKFNELSKREEKPPKIILNSFAEKDVFTKYSTKH